MLRVRRRTHSITIVCDQHHSSLINGDGSIISPSRVRYLSTWLDYKSYLGKTYGATDSKEIFNQGGSSLICQPALFSSNATADIAAHLHTCRTRQHYHCISWLECTTTAVRAHRLTISAVATRYLDMGKLKSSPYCSNMLLCRAAGGRDSSEFKSESANGDRLSDEAVGLNLRL